MHAMSAAHPTLPLPTLVRITNLENGKQAIVRVNDRGPFKKSRLIDVSYAAAKALGFSSQGTARVRVQTLESANPQEHEGAAPAIAPAYIQLGAFASKANADRLYESLVDQFPQVQIQPFSKAKRTLYRVRIGPFSDVSDIERTMLSLQNSTQTKPIVVLD